MGVRQKSFLLEAQGSPWDLQDQVQEAEQALEGLGQGLAQESSFPQHHKDGDARAEGLTNDLMGE